MCIRDSPLNVQPFVVDEILTPDIHTANWGGLLWHLQMCIRDRVEIIDVHGGQLALKRREDAADGHVHALSLSLIHI